MIRCLSLLIAILLSSVRTLNTELELKDTKFGFPPPRHGLALLKWYVKNCIDNNMVALCNPMRGEFGFHEFRNVEFLLPRLDRMHKYFTVGNLNLYHSKDLPYEVRRYYHPQDKLSNMDRVIVALNQNKNKIEDIYISEHYHLLRTFRIGASLIDDLRWDQNLTTV